MDDKLELGIKASHMTLEMAGAEDMIIIATDGVKSEGSLPQDPHIAAMLFAYALDEAPKGTKEAIKTYLEG